MISQMSDREKCAKRRQWKTAQRKLRKKKADQEEALTPPATPNANMPAQQNEPPAVLSYKCFHTNFVFE